ncbi:MAG: hypothetical protein ACOCV1_00875 [Bacillota bacterium]
MLNQIENIHEFLDILIKKFELDNESIFKYIEDYTKEFLEKETSNDKKYMNRFHVEIKEIYKAGLTGYYIGLIKSKNKYENSINSLCAYLWKICDENPLENNKNLLWDFSFEMPDLDIDFTPEKRNEIKEYCSSKFGENKVVSIANYNHFGIKSGIRDVARVLEVPIQDVSFTTSLKDDVNKMSWEEAIDNYPQLAEFENKYPEVCKLVRKFNGRVRSIGKHAGGLVISNVDLTKTIPLLTRKDENGKSFLLSSFAEGQNRSDLKTVGLIKQDILGLENLNYISTCLNIMESRGKYDRKKGLFKLSPEHEEWTDESYLNDLESIKKANDGDLLSIFQFDSPGMRGLIRSGGVSCFEDLVSYTSLFRPGPLNSGMAKEYVNRKKQIEEYDSHPVLDPIIGNTLGVICYQEQLMKIMNIVGLISLQDCDQIRRAMSKKKREGFIKYKDIFIENGQKVLGPDWIKRYDDHKQEFLDFMKSHDPDFYRKYNDRYSFSEEQKKEIEDQYEKIYYEYRQENRHLKFVEYLWDQMETFARYGFNRCISQNSVVETPRGKTKIKDCKIGDIIKSYSVQDKCFVWDQIINIHTKDKAETFSVKIESGLEIKCTANHTFLCSDGIKRPLHDIKDKKIITEESLEGEKIVSIKKHGIDSIIDIEVSFKDHNFLANGFVVGNSHAVSYTMISARCLYLSAHYPHEYITSVLCHLKTGDHRVKLYIDEFRKKGIVFDPLDINESKIGYSLKNNDHIVIGFDKIKGISKEAANLIKLQPFKSFDDYLDRYGCSKTVGETLIKCGAFDEFEDNMKLLLEYFNYYRDNSSKENGMGRLDFGRCYKELTGSKSCPKDMTNKFVELLEKDKKKIGYRRLLELIMNGCFDFTEIPKQSLIEYVESKKEDFINERLSLENFKQENPSVQDFTNKEKCNFEIEFYTFFIKRHPLNDFQINNFQSIGNALSKAEQASNNCSFLIEGIITKVEPRKMKNKNENIYFITIEDKYDELPLMLWKNQYEEYKNMLYKGNAIKLKVSPSNYSSWNLSKGSSIQLIPIVRYVDPDEDFLEQLEETKGELNE